MPSKSLWFLRNGPARLRLGTDASRFFEVLSNFQQLAGHHGVDTPQNRPTIQIHMASAAPAPEPQDSSLPADETLFRIGEVSRLTATKTFVLRYWETEFPTLQPVKSPSGHRLYRREDIETVFEIKRLLYDEGFTIAGARRFLAGHTDTESSSPAADQRAGTENSVSSDAFSHAARPVAPSRRSSTSAQHRKFLLDLHQELLAVLTLLERE
jgi:DNA-binding transcriptional MerR regulator